MEELLLTLRKEAAGTSCGLALGIVQTVEKLHDFVQNFLKESLESFLDAEGRRFFA